MKKTLLTIAIALISSMLFSQDYNVQVDSIAENTAYVQVVRVLTDTLSVTVNREMVQTNIQIYNNQVKFLYKALTAYNNEYADPTYTPEFKAQIKKDIDDLSRRLKYLIRERAQLVAIRDSIISYIN